MRIGLERVLHRKPDRAGASPGPRQGRPRRSATSDVRLEARRRQRERYAPFRLVGAAYLVLLVGFASVIALRFTSGQRRPGAGPAVGRPPPPTTQPLAHRPPLALSFSARPLEVPSSGGTLELTGTARAAGRCTVGGPGVGHHTEACATGIARYRAVLPPNHTSRRVSYRFWFSATSRYGRSTRLQVTILEGADVRVAHRPRGTAIAAGPPQGPVPSPLQAQRRPEAASAELPYRLALPSYPSTAPASTSPSRPSPRHTAAPPRRRHRQRPTRRPPTSLAATPGAPRQAPPTSTRVSPVVTLVGPTPSTQVDQHQGTGPSSLPGPSSTIPEATTTTAVAPASPASSSSAPPPVTQATGPGPTSTSSSTSTTLAKPTTSSAATSTTTAKRPPATTTPVSSTTSPAKKTAPTRTPSS